MAPVRLGTAFIQWPGNSEPPYDGPLLQIVDNPPGGDSWTLWVDRVGVAQYSGFHGGEYPNIMPTPEPSSIALACLAMSSMIGLVRRLRLG